MQGMHRRMEDVWLPNQVISQYELSVRMDVLEARWGEAQETVIDHYDTKCTATTACIVLAGYFASLRGEEINCVDLGAMIKYWDEATTHANHPHMALMLSGMFKAETGVKFSVNRLPCKQKLDEILVFGFRGCWRFVRAKGRSWVLYL